MLNLIQTTALKEEKKSVLLNNFRQQTGSSLTDALSYLDVCNWDYQFSVGVFGLLGLKNASRSKTNFTKLNDSLVEMNEFFAPQSSEGEETMNFTQRKRTVETIYEEKTKDEQDEQEEEEEEILSKISEEEHLRKLDKLENILSHGFLNWDKRLRAIIEFDPELIIGYPHHLKTKNQITIKKKYSNSSPNTAQKRFRKKIYKEAYTPFLQNLGSEMTQNTTTMS